MMPLDVLSTVSLAAMLAVALYNLATAPRLEDAGEPLALPFGQRLEASGALAWEGRALRNFVRTALISFNTAIWMDAAGNGPVLWLGVLMFAALAAWQGLALRALTLLVGFTAAHVRS